MKAYKEGYSFNFIEGEMWEKSPFTLWDFIQQRKRWIQGILLVVHSKEIPVFNKIFLAISCYSWVTLPFSTSNVLLAGLCPIPCPHILDLICGFIGAVNIYMYIFGVLKSFPIYRFGPLFVGVLPLFHLILSLRILQLCGEFWVRNINFT
jgi:beta-1,4-mannosyltransferase